MVPVCMFKVTRDNLCVPNSNVAAANRSIDVVR